MLNLIRNLLLLIINDIDSGNSNISEKEQREAISLILKITSLELSKIEAAEYLGISRATFDNRIALGKLPKGRKRPGFKELSWNKYELSKYD